MAKRRSASGPTLAELQERLQRFTDAIEDEVEREGDPYELDDVLSPEFLKEHTRCKSFAEFQALFSFDLNKDEYTDAETRVLNLYVRKNTKFRAFSQFILVAMAQHATNEAKRKVLQKSP
jgi:hypothetical protein